MTLIRRLAREERGATAVEYAMIALVIAVVIISGVTLVGKGTANNLNLVVNGFANAGH